MGFFQNAFGDNRVLTSDNPDVQKTLDYMGAAYKAYIIEYKERRGSSFMIECHTNFEFLYAHRYIDNGHVVVPGKGALFTTFDEAYAGLVWLYRTFEGAKR